jgi:magnesium dechelatase
LLYDIAFEFLLPLWPQRALDEVLAEFKSENGELSLNLHYHVCGGFVFGWAKLRYKIFCRFISYNVQAIRFGDKAFFEKNPEFDNARVLIHFYSSNKKYEKTEEKGILSEYTL